MKINLPVSGQEKCFAANKSMVTKTNTKGVITFANQDFIDVSGFSKEELIGKTHNLIRHPDMPPIAFEIMWKTLERGSPWHGIVKNRCKNGDHYWVDAKIVPIKKNGSITGYMSVRTSPSREQIATAEAAYKIAITAPETIKEDVSYRWKRQLSIKNGIPLWILFVTILMIGGGVLGITGLNMSKADIQALYHKEMVPVQAIHRINFLMADNRAQVALALNFKFGAHSDIMLHPSANNDHMGVMNKNKIEIDRIWAAYNSSVTDPKEQALAKEYVEARGFYVQYGLLQAQKAIENEDYLGAQRAFFNQVNPLYDVANARAAVLLAYLSERGGEKITSTTERGDLIFKMAVAGITLSCLVLIIAGIIFFRITAKPLEKAVLALEDIAQGNLSSHIEPSGYGEPERVMSAVMVTQMHLKVMIHEIQQSASSIHVQCNNLNKVMMDLAEHSDEQHDRIYHTVDTVKASRTAMTAITHHMDSLLESVDNNNNNNQNTLSKEPSTELLSQPSIESTPVFDFMPAELRDVFGDDFPEFSEPVPPPVAAVVQAVPIDSPSEYTAPSVPNKVNLINQVQTVASAVCGQSLAVEEVASQLNQVAGLIVQNREDVQGAWAASQRLEQTARELDELVKYFD